MAFLVWHAGASPGMGTDGTPGNPSVPLHPGRHMHHVTVSLCCTLAYWRFCTNGRFLMAPARDSTTYGPGGLVALTPPPSVPNWTPGLGIWLALSLPVLSI